MKTTADKIKRSAFCHLISTMTPNHRALSNKADVWGAVLIVALSVGTVSLVRVLLSLG